MKLETFFEKFDQFSAAPDAVAKMRKLILQLAVQGRLKSQGDESGFPQVRLDSLGSWAQGCGFPVAEQGHVDRPILFSKVSDMNLPGNEREILKTNHTIDEAAAKRLRIKVHPPGTVIFPKIGGAIATNKRRVLVRPTAIDNNCSGIIPNKSCSTHWLFLVLSAIDFAEYQSGTSVPAVNQGALGEIEVSLPPLAEQKRIVAKVDELMALCDRLAAQQKERETRHAALARASLARFADAPTPANLTFLFHKSYAIPPADLRKSILTLAVQGKLVPQHPNDESAVELLARIAATKMRLQKAGDIGKEKPVEPLEPDSLPFESPDSWRWARLAELTELITKGSSPKWQGIAYVPASEGILFITSENVGNYVLRKLDDLKYVSKAFNEIEPRSILKRGDILMNLVGASIGRTAVYDLHDGANINQAVALIRLVRDTGGVCPRFLLHYLNSPSAIDYMLSSRVVNAQPNISLTDAREFVVPIPPLAEQRRIVAKVDELMVLVDELEVQVAASRDTGEKLLAALVAELTA